jgi:hypothetical protein
MIPKRSAGGGTHFQREISQQETTRSINQSHDGSQFTRSTFATCRRQTAAPMAMSVIRNLGLSIEIAGLYEAGEEINEPLVLFI